MRYAIFITVSKLLPEKYVAAVLLSQTNYHKRKALRKGFRLVSFEQPQGFEQHADNFVRNRITWRVDCERYKIPRIVKHLLYEKTNSIAKKMVEGIR